MYLRLLLGFYLFLLPTAFAEELNVRYRLKNYSLKYDSSNINISSSLLNLSIKKETCNESIVEKFNHQVDYMLRRAIKLKKPESSFLEITAQNKFYISDRSPAGKFFRLVPDEVKRLKIESDLKCKKR